MSAHASTETAEVVHRIERFEPGCNGWQFHATAPSMTAEQAMDIADGLNRRSRTDRFRAVRITVDRKTEILSPEHP